jgi:DNA repair photolyase
VDRSRSILSENDSPDVPFRFGANPYRGCEHGCVYCYARPSHEYWGFSAGLDFESKILVKPDAPALLRAELRRPSWRGDVVCLSGNTDCYQPAERSLRLTRRCLETLFAAENPAAIITKSALVARDVDLLGPAARAGAAVVTVTLTTLDPRLARRLEPRASSPAARLAAITSLAAAGVPTGVNVAPVVPGLTDEEIPALLKAAQAAGARFAGYTMLRLPGAVEPLFVDWLRREEPLRAEKVLGRLREMRGGSLQESRFGVRMRGEGPFASLIAALFRQTCARLGLEPREPATLLRGARRAQETQPGLFDGAI